MSRLLEKLYIRLSVVFHKVMVIAEDAIVIFHMSQTLRLNRFSGVRFRVLVFKGRGSRAEAREGTLPEP